MRPPKTGLVGLGRWGSQHLRVLRALGVPLLATDLDPRRVPVEGGVRGFEDLLEDEEVRAVVIATPPRTHAPLARRALEAGKDVLVEKPLTLEEPDARQLVALAERLGAVLMVGHVTLFHPAIERLLALCRAGELGRLHYAHATRLNLGIVRADEDALFSFAPHDIAVLRELFGAAPVAVSATGGSFLKPGRHDVTVTHLAFPGGPGGPRAHIFVSWLHPVKEHRLVVVGDERMAVFTDRPGGGELVLYEQGARIAEGVPVPRDEDGRRVDFRWEEPLRREVAHFLDCVRTRATPRCGPRHALDVMEVLGAARSSLTGGREEGRPPGAAAAGLVG